MPISYTAAEMMVQSTWGIDLHQYAARCCLQALRQQLVTKGRALAEGAPVPAFTFSTSPAPTGRPCLMGAGVRLLVRYSYSHACFRFATSSSYLPSPQVCHRVLPTGNPQQAVAGLKALFRGFKGSPHNCRPTQSGIGSTAIFCGFASIQEKKPRQGSLSGANAQTVRLGQENSFHWTG